MRTRTLAEQNRLDAQEQHATELWLKGFKPSAIAEEVGVSLSHVYRILKLARTLLNAGEYDAELAANAAAGFTGLPVKGQSLAGRPPAPFTEQELQVRALAAQGKGPSEIGKLLKLTRFQVRDIVSKSAR